jgi:hypothetical protein
LRQVKIIESDKYKMDIALMLYGGNKTALISFKENVVLVVENEDIQKSLKSLFEFV